MKNEILKYHIDTSYRRSHMEGSPLDWECQPDVYKKYPVKDHIPLEEVSFTQADDIFDLSKAGPEARPLKPISLNILSKILALGFSLTAVATYQGKDFFYRSMASAGALYPNEIYLAVYDVLGLNPGIYHYMIRERVFVPVRLGNCKPSVESVPKLSNGEPLAASFFISGIFFRTSWKYRKRGYRYVLNDTGHLVENIYYSILFEGISPVVSYDFDDEGLNMLLGFDSKKEVCLALMHIPGQSAPDSINGNIDKISALSEKMTSASTVSAREVDYNEILDIHRESQKIVENPDSIITYEPPIGLQTTHWVDIPYPGLEKPGFNYLETISKRRSKRNYIPKSMSSDDFHFILSLLCDRINSASKKLTASIYPAVGMLVENVEDYEKGVYLLDPCQRKAGLVDKGRFASLSATVCLNQQWLSNAAVHFLFMADLDHIEKHFGPRGYRYLMIGAGRLGQLIYLGATALGLGSCGIGALYDFEAQEMLNLSDNTFLLYLVAAGPVRK